MKPTASTELVVTSVLTVPTRLADYMALNEPMSAAAKFGTWRKLTANLVAAS